MSTYTPPFPNLTNASGIFTLQEVEDAMKNKSWPDLNSRAIIGGGYTPSRTNVIDFVEIASTGNATDFGDLTAAVQSLGAANNKQRGVFGGGYTGSGAGTDTMDYITVASNGDAVDFGNLSVTRRDTTGFANKTRGVFSGGNVGSYPAFTGSNVMDYITIASTGNAADFGDLTQARGDPASFSSPIRGITANGSAAPALSNVIDFVTIATTGNATDFGDASSIAYRGGCSSHVRGLIASGENPSASGKIEYITIASEGNAIDFGDTSTTRNQCASNMSNSIRGLFGAGSNSNVIDFVTIATAGNATDFGDLTTARTAAGGMGAGHGGLV